MVIGETKMRYIYLGLLLLVVGCTTPVYECPVVTCPGDVDKGTVLDEFRAVVVEYDGYTVWMEKEEDYLINCGNTAHGPITVNTLKKGHDITRIYINNTHRDFIGGCPDVLKAFPEIEGVYIYAEAVNTDEYRDMIDWIPTSKLFIETDKEVSLETFK